MDKYKKLKLVEINNEKIDLPKIIYDSRLQTKNHVDFLEKINYLYTRNPTIKKKPAVNKQKKSFLLQSSNNNTLEDDDDDEGIDEEDEQCQNRRREKLLLEKKLQEKAEKYNKHKRMFERKVDIWSLKGNKRTSLFDNKYQMQTNNNTIYTSSNNFRNKNSNNGLYITYCDATVSNTLNNTKYETERLSRLGNTSSQMNTNYTSLNRTENSMKKKKIVTINLYPNDTKKICKNKVVNNFRLEKKLLVNKNQLNLRTKENSYNYNNYNTIGNSNKDSTYYEISDVNSLSNNINIDNNSSTSYANNYKDYGEHTIDIHNDTSTPVLDLKNKPIKLSKSKVRESLLKYQQLKKSNPSVSMEKLIDTKCQNVLDNLVDNFSLINSKGDKNIQIDDIINKLNKKQKIKGNNIDNNDLEQLETIKKKKEEEKMITEFNEIINNRDFFYKSDKLSSLNTKFAYDAQDVIKVLFNYYDDDHVRYRKHYKGDPNRNRNSLMLKKLLEMNIREKNVCVKKLNNYQERDLKLKKMDNNVVIKNEEVKVKKEFYY